MKNKYVVGIILCLIAVISWGGMFPVMVPALKVIDPFYFTLFRYGAVALIFSIILLVTEKKQAFRTEGHLLKIWLLGTFAFVGFNFLVFGGQNIAGSSGAIIASVMMTTQPLLGALLNWGRNGIKPSKGTIVAMIIALIGALMVVTKGYISQLWTGHNSLLAMLLILISAFCWVVYTMGGSEFPEWSILRYSTLTTIYGVISVVVVLLIMTAMGILEVPSINQIIAVSHPLIYMITFAGFIAVFVWNYGNRILGTINGILFINLIPIVSFAISVVQGYRLTFFESMGCLLTIVALIFNNIYDRYISSKESI